MIATLASLLVGLSPADAAELTNLPPAMRGDLDIRYLVDVENTRLVEDSTQVGQRRLTEHELVYAPTFAFVKGVGLALEIPHYPSVRLAYPSASQMSVDPTTDSGTMVGSDAVTLEPELGSGFGGVYLGLRGSPMHQELFSARGDRLSWLLDVGIRFPDRSNLWSYKEGGADKRGAGPGALGFKISTAFSTTHHGTQPYVRFGTVQSSRLTMDIRDSTGAKVASNVIVRPPSETEMIAGAEITLTEYGEAEKAAYVKADLRGIFTYESWSWVPSGTLMPSVLEDTTGLIATQSERVTVMGQAGIDWRFHEVVELQVAGRVGTATPQTVEHFYPVEAGMGGIAWGVHTTLRFRLRDWLVEGAGGSAGGMGDDEFLD